MRGKAGRFSRRQTFDADTELLLHFDCGTPTDSSGNALSVSAIGGARNTQAQSRFGGSSVQFPDVYSDYIAVPSATALGSGDFTVEFWIYPPHNDGGVAGTRGASFGSSSSVWGVLFYFGTLNWHTNVTIVLAAASALPTNAWSHVAFVRTGSTLKLYINGVEDASVTDTRNYQAAQLYIGQDGENLGSFGGYIDEFRISSVARYTGAFTPPAAAFAS